MPAVRNNGSRNKDLARGIKYNSRAKAASKSGKWRFSGSGQAKAAKAPKAAAQVGKYYPADDEAFPLQRRFTPKSAKLRSSIVPGSVLILLSGRHRGKRVVFLKQLPSGLLLVTGPYKVNGCPLRRVNQVYVIATSTTVDVSAVSVPAEVNDDFFKRQAAAPKADEEGFFATEEATVTISDERKAIQKSVDAAILSKLDKVTKQYLNAKFSLTKGQFPHLMKF